VDYEVIKGANGHRLIGFGRYAGVVGAYNALRAYGVKHNLYDLKPAHLCEDRAEMEAEMDHIKLPENTKIVLTGFGRVGHGALEIMHKLGLKEVEPEAFRLQTFNQPVYCRLDTHEYNARKSDGGYDQSEFYSDPSGYVSTFARFTSVANMYIACHYWGEGSPFLFTREDIKNPAWNVSVVGDISCDIDGPVASTIRSSTIAAPLYGYHRFTEKECDLHNKDAICVMAVDNLPCELPKDASEDFGNELIKHVLPVLLGEDPHNIIGRASETDLNGKLTRHFTYLADYVAKG
jgi:saccharopine dehydrogenase (NAD+, L-lysine forming)